MTPLTLSLTEFLSVAALDSRAYAESARELTFCLFDSSLQASMILNNGSFAYSISLHDLIPDLDITSFISTREYLYEFQYYRAVSKYSYSHCAMISCFCHFGLHQDFWHDALRFYQNYSNDHNNPCDCYPSFSTYWDGKSWASRASINFQHYLQPVCSIPSCK